MDIDEKILAFLSDGPKYYKDFKSEFVDDKKICSNTILSKHLSELYETKRIDKTNIGRRTRYTILPEFAEKGERLHNYYALENLINTLHSVAIDSKLNLVEVKPKPSLLENIRLDIDPFENLPHLRFALQCDEALTKKLALFTKLEEISKGFRNQIISNFGELVGSIPPTVDMGIDSYYKQITTFDSTQTLSRNIANKYNFRFLLYSWFDGEAYANRILRASKKLDSLKKGHEDDILFLDEICNRYFYAWNEYMVATDFVQEGVVPKILDGCSVNSLLDDAYWLHVMNRFDVCALEAVLVSDSLCVDENISAIGVVSHTKERVAYRIVGLDDYVKLKFGLLDNNGRKAILGDLLAEVQKEHDEMLVRFYNEFVSATEDERTQLFNDKVDLFERNLKYLEEELGVLYHDTDAEKLRNDIIFNFKFVLDGVVRDFADTVLAKGFMRFLRDPSKRIWLQKCLETGIPVYSNMPFDKIGFTYSKIL